MRTVHLVLGFASREKDAPPVELYMGTDGEAAKAALAKGGKKITRAEWHRIPPAPYKRRVYLKPDPAVSVPQPTLV